ncbi:MAG: hypothetical protein ACO3AV_09930, partial [Ilumatobacteraceae bacterium]
MSIDNDLPRWHVGDVHESFESRTFQDAMERHGSDIGRLEALFDHHGIRAVEPRPVTIADGRVADEIIKALNDGVSHADVTEAYIYATTSTDTFDERAEGLMAEFSMAANRRRPLTARLAEWMASLGVEHLATVSEEVLHHPGPLEKLAARA